MEIDNYYRQPQFSWSNLEFKTDSLGKFYEVTFYFKN